MGQPAQIPQIKQNCRDEYVYRACVKRLYSLTCLIARAEMHELYDHSNPKQNHIEGDLVCVVKGKHLASGDSLTQRHGEPANKRNDEFVENLYPEVRRRHIAEG